LLCVACGATLDFGQHKQGDTLFPKRFDRDERSPLPNRGWYRYQGKPAESTPTKTATAPMPGPTAPPADVHKLIVENYAKARATADAEMVERWRRWAAKFTFTDQQQKEQTAAHRAALERIARASDPARRQPAVS
jgi:hypothetical protein